MEFPLLKKILHDCSKFIIKPRIHFSGAEPSTYPQIVEAFEACKKNKLRWGMTTNGYFLERFAEDIVKNNCRALNISVHGDEKIHSNIVGISNSYKKILNGLMKLDEAKKRFNKSRPTVAINCVFNNYNVLKLKEILHNFLQLPINSITFQHLVFSEKDMDNNEKFLIKKDKLQKILEFYDYIAKNRSKFNVKINFFPNVRRKDIPGYYTDKNYRFSNTCFLPWFAVKIHQNGDIKLCNVFFGNIAKNSLKKIINSKEARRFRYLVSKGKFKIPNCFRCCHRRYENLQV